MRNIVIGRRGSLAIDAPSGRSQGVLNPVRRRYVRASKPVTRSNGQDHWVGPPLFPGQCRVLPTTATRREDYAKNRGTNVNKSGERAWNAVLESAGRWSPIVTSYSRRRQPTPPPRARSPPLSWPAAVLVCCWWCSAGSTKMKTEDVILSPPARLPCGPVRPADTFPVQLSVLLFVVQPRFEIRKLCQ